MPPRARNRHRGLFVVRERGPPVRLSLSSCSHKKEWNEECSRAILFNVMHSFAGLHAPCFDALNAFSCIGDRPSSLLIYAGTPLFLIFGPGVGLGRVWAPMSAGSVHHHQWHLQRDGRKIGSGTTARGALPFPPLGSERACRWSPRGLHCREGTCTQVQ